MTHRIALLALFATFSLAACGVLDQDAAYTNAECRKAMYDDPAVRRALPAVSQQNTILGGTGVLREAKDEAYGKCMRENGLAPKGGVERVKRGWL